jgi:hypothetical protein
VNMVMAGQRGASRIPDELVVAIVRHVLVAIGIEDAAVEEDPPAGVRRMENRLEASRELIARQTARTTRKMAALDAVAVAADGYRESVRKGKAGKSARTKLFDAVAEWRETR